MKQLICALALGLTALATSCSTPGAKAGKDKTGDTATSCHGASTSDWQAWGNVQPGSNQTLHVTGKVSTPTGGWKVALQERFPQGTSERILILDLNVTPPAPGSIVTQAIVVHTPHYQKKGAARKYDKVEIHCREGDKDKVLANLDVELAH